MSFSYAGDAVYRREQVTYFLTTRDSYDRRKLPGHWYHYVR